ncbi:MAG: capsular biosynthesis protein [Hyphomicrobiales bacterium]|nr:capsular biosynthesis protein [Hyphomicrobiales bacterium]
MGDVTSRRSFIFLQGPLSPLYARLGADLKTRGASVLRVNFCPGDWLDWRGPDAASYRGRIADWPGAFDDLLRERAATDIVMHGERRLYHRIAAAVARRRGVRVMVTELGYVRPGFMTVEPNGTGAGSHFPDEAAAIRRIAASAPPASAPPDRTEFWRVALPDVIYNMVNSLAWPLYPRYRRHTIYYPPLEYLAWGVRLATGPRRDAEAAAALRSLQTRGGPFFVLAMQLEGDYQIRHRSPFRSLSEVVDAVLASFAEHAPQNAALCVKAHPLDNGLDGWRGRLREASRRLNLERRIVLIDGGSLGAALTGAAGLVTVNSSAGLEALEARAPVKTLAPAIYDVPGLTHRGPLSSFWRAPEPPCPALFADFKRALVAATQTPGSIYSQEGLHRAVASIAERLWTAPLSKPDGLAPAHPRATTLRAALRKQRGEL